MYSETILFYDGECSFCNKTVQWVLKHNDKANIQFASLQGQTAQTLLYEQNNLDQTIDSVILYHNKKLYFYSDAALELVKQLNKPLPMLYLLKIFPSSIRNWVYKGFAKRRYKWFGMATSCQIPTVATRQRFID